MQAVFVDLCNEISDIDQEVEHLAVALARKSAEEDDPQKQWEATHMRASAVEKIYSGCERIMRRFAADFDGAPVNLTDGWHAALLKRLTRPFPGSREAVLSPDCSARLDRLRAFRHRERNSYGINLDPQLVLERAHEAIETFGCFKQELNTFMRAHGFAPTGSNAAPP